MKTSETLKEIAPALVAFQAEVKDPRKDSDNPYFKSKYVELDGLMMAVRPVANRHGLYISQDVTTEMTESGKTKVWCRTRLTHSSGEFVESDGQFNVAKGNDPQSIGSSETYIRRYDLSAFLGIAWDKDDDGNAASQADKRKEQHPTQAQANELEVLCQKCGKKIQDMLGYFHVHSVTELDMKTFQRIKNTLEYNLTKEAAISRDQSRLEYEMQVEAHDGGGEQ